MPFLSTQPCEKIIVGDWFVCSSHRMQQWEVGSGARTAAVSKTLICWSNLFICHKSFINCVHARLIWIKPRFCFSFSRLFACVADERDLNMAALLKWPSSCVCVCEWNKKLVSHPSDPEGKSDTAGPRGCSLRKNKLTSSYLNQVCAVIPNRESLTTSVHTAPPFLLPHTHPPPLPPVLHLAVISGCARPHLHTHTRVHV